jgi:hypothetical protein
VAVEYHRIGGGAHGFDRSGFFTADVGHGLTPFEHLLDHTVTMLSPRA